MCVYTRRAEALRAVPRPVPGPFPFPPPGTDRSAKKRREEDAQFVKERTHKR